MSHGPGLLGEVVHYVRATDTGPRCAAALVTDVAGGADAYRDHAVVGLRAWTDTEEIIVPLGDGGVRYDVGRAPWASEYVAGICDGQSREAGTWHYRDNCPRD